VLSKPSIAGQQEWFIIFGSGSTS